MKSNSDVMKATYDIIFYYSVITISGVLLMSKSDRIQCNSISNLLILHCTKNEVLH